MSCCGKLRYKELSDPPVVGYAWEADTTATTWRCIQCHLAIAADYLPHPVRASHIVHHKVAEIIQTSAEEPAYEKH
jgi:hypothetical protein